MRCHIASEIHALWGTRVSGGEPRAMMILQHFANAATESDACHQGGGGVTTSQASAMAAWTLGKRKPSLENHGRGRTGADARHHMITAEGTWSVLVLTAIGMSCRGPAHSAQCFMQSSKTTKSMRCRVLWGDSHVQ